MSSLQERARNSTLLILALTLLFSLVLSTCVRAQNLSLAEAYTLLEAHYPKLRNAGLNDKILRTELDILALERKPTVSLYGSATLQSETTNFGDAAENLPVEIDIPLYNLRSYGEINYSVYDGGRLAARKRLTAAEGALDNQQLEIERFGLRQRINQLFLGVLLTRERVALYETTLDDIAERKSVTAASVELGAALESELLQLSVREVEIEADRDDLIGTIARLLANLGTLIGRHLPPDVALVLPNLPDLRTVSEVDRPELEMYQLRRQAVLANEAVVTAETKPVVSAFAQAGVGLPNPLNVFDSNLAPYAIGGFNFRWRISDWGRSDHQRQQLQLRAAQIQNERATFLFNLNAGNEAYLADVDRLERQVEQDRRIAELQAEILDQLAAQLDNGVITATDYLTQANAELRARQALRVDRARLTELQLNFLNERGSF